MITCPSPSLDPASCDKAVGAVIQAGQSFEDPSPIDFLGTWEDVRKGAYDAHSMIVENEEDGVWGSVLQPSQGLFWYRIRDGRLLSEICRVYNDWIADFCKPYPDRLKGIAMLNVDNVEQAGEEPERLDRMEGEGCLRSGGAPLSPTLGAECPKISLTSPRLRILR